VGVCNAGFELGVNGATIGTTVVEADGDRFNQATVPGDGTMIYDAARAALGSQSAKIATVTAGTPAFGWNENSPVLGTLTDHYGRAYLYLTGNPSVNLAWLACQLTGASCSRIIVTTTGKLQINDSANTLAGGPGAVSLTPNQWVRVEWHFVHSTTVGMGEVKLFNTPGSATPDETITTPANKNMNSSANRVIVGIINSAANIGPYWLDQIVAGIQGAYPGPAPLGRPSRTLLGVGA